MFPIALLFSLIVASPVAQSSQASPDENMVDTIPEMTTTISSAGQPTTPAFDGPSLSQIKTDWRRDYERLPNKHQVMDDARTALIPNHILDNLSEIYSQKGNGTITYRCQDTNTFGRFVVRQYMEIGQGSNTTILKVSDGGPVEISHTDGSAIVLSSILNEIPNPVNPDKNGDWAAYSLKQVPSAKIGKLTGATVGYIDNVKGGYIPNNCSVVGRDYTFSIVATYHLFK